MSNFLDLLMNAFSGPVVRLISQRLGISPEQAQLALSQFLPIIMKALAGNASQKTGATALYNAVERDHDGSIFDQLQDFLGHKRQQEDGRGINRHVFGNQTSTVARFIGQTTGLSPETTSKLMEMAAPMVMGLLGKEQRQQQLNEEGLSHLLRNSTREVQQTDPINMGMIGKLLDADGDGDIMDDVAKMGMGFLKTWMNGRTATIG